MSNSGLGFGGFLLGVGGGWFLFQYIDFNFDVISYLLILMGVGIILGSVLSKGGKHTPSDIFGGFIGGLFFAVFLTQGFGLIDVVTDQWEGVDSSIYRATDMVSLEAPLDVEALMISVENVNGAIDVSSWNGDSIQVELEIRARGSNDAEAERNLDDFDYRFIDTTVGGTQEISLDFPITSSKWSLFSVYVTIYVPEDAETDLVLSSTNGRIDVTEMTLTGANVDTTNGVITFDDVESPLFTADTTNGGVFGTITASQTSFSTTNGIIDIRLNELSGEHIFDTTNGMIEIALPSGDHIGYRIDLDTSIGGIDVGLPGIDYSVDKIRTKIGETTGFDSKDIQIEIRADTTIGAIALN